MRRKYFYLLIIAVPLVICGCAHFRSAPLSASQAAASFEARRLNDPGLKKFLETNLLHEISPWPPRKWDPAVLTFVAFYYHPDLDVARAKWGVAKAGVSTAGEHPNPTIGFSPQYVNNADIGSTPWVLPFVLNIPIETAGKRGYRISQAKNLSEAARYNIASVAWGVRNRLRKSLLDLYAAARSVEILKKQLVLQEKNLKLMEERSAANALSPFVVNEAGIGLGKTLLSLSELQKQEAEARVRVADSLGVSVRSLDDVDFVFDSFDHPLEELPPSEVRREALLGRPDILAALAEYAAAELALRIEIAKQYPDINIGPGYEFDQGQNKWGLGLSITLPIFNQNKGAIAKAEARRIEAEANFNALQAKVVGEIDQATAGYEAARKEFKAAERLLAAQENKQRLLEASIGQGEVRRVALLQARIESDAVALSYLRTLVDTERALGLLEDAVQRPLGPR